MVERRDEPGRWHCHVKRRAINEDEDFDKQVRNCCVVSCMPPREWTNEDTGEEVDQVFNVVACINLRSFVDEIDCSLDMKEEMRSVKFSKAQRKTVNDGLSRLKSLQEAMTEVFETVGSDVQDQPDSSHSTTEMRSDPSLSVALKNLGVDGLSCG